MKDAKEKKEKGEELMKTLDALPENKQERLLGYSEGLLARREDKKAG